MVHRRLQLEVWIDRSSVGESLPELCYAGPRGDCARQLLTPNAQLLTTINASSHFEAMSIYYRLMGWGEYSTNEQWDHEPYPDEWLQEQESAGISSADA